MNTKTFKLTLAGICVVAIGGLAACGSSDDSSTAASTPASSTTASSSPAKAAGAAEIDIDDNADLGQILVDADGNTVYLFEADEGTKSTCDGACAQAWPPVLTKGDPGAGTGADASLLGTTKRSDGSTEVTYAGHPLYYYAGDQAPGDTNGNNLDQFGAEWYALTPTGDTPEDGAAPPSDSSTTSSDSGGTPSGY